MLLTCWTKYRCSCVNASSATKGIPTQLCSVCVCVHVCVHSSLTSPQLTVGQRKDVSVTGDTQSLCEPLYASPLGIDPNSNNNPAANATICEDVVCETQAPVRTYNRKPLMTKSGGRQKRGNSSPVEARTKSLWRGVADDFVRLEPANLA